MSDLIEALQIFLKYGNPKWPTSCEHDVMYIMEIEPSKVSTEDTTRLAELGFNVDEDLPAFYSFRFGSA